MSTDAPGTPDPATALASIEPLPRRLCSIDDLDRSRVAGIMAAADAMVPVARGERRFRPLEGRILASLFFEPSTRTRLSFGAAFQRLGGSVLDVTDAGSTSLAKGETLADMGRIVSGYADVIVMRHPTAGAVAEFARGATVPLVSGGDGAGEHPTQALLDLFAILRETGRPLEGLGDLVVTMVGDLLHGRTVHSLLRLLAMVGPVTVRLVAPEGLGMPADLIERARAAGCRVDETDELAAGIEGARVVYCTRVQSERFATSADADRHRGRLRLDRAIVERHARPDVVLLHPLPRDGRPEADELPTDLDDLPNLACFRQSDGGVPVRMVVLAGMVGVGWPPARDDGPDVRPGRR